MAKLISREWEVDAAKASREKKERERQRREKKEREKGTERQPFCQLLV